MVSVDNVTQISSKLSIGFSDVIKARSTLQAKCVLNTFQRRLIKIA